MQGRRLEYQFQHGWANPSRGRHSALALPLLDFSSYGGFRQAHGPILDLYGGFWEGKPLRKDEYVISADEKTSIQARSRDQRLAQVPTKRLGWSMITSARVLGTTWLLGMSTGA